MTTGFADGLSVDRVSTHPALVLPANLVRTARDQGPQAAVGELWPVGAEKINISDLRVKGYDSAVSLGQCLELVERLEQGPQTGERARVVAVLRERIAVHAAALADQAKTRAVEAVAGELASRRDAGPPSHGSAPWQRAVRSAVAVVAADLRCAVGQVKASIRAASVMEQVPAVAAAALQGQVGPMKLRLLAKAWAAVPPQMRVDAVAGKMLQVVVDNPSTRAEREIRTVLALLTQATDGQTLEKRVRRHAGIHVTDLGGGLAELTVVDRAEHIQVVATVAVAAGLAARHAGIEGSIGQLRSSALANMAIQALRDQKVPTAYGSQLPLEARNGQPVRLEMLQVPIPSLLPPAPGMPNVQWTLRDAGNLTTAQAAALRDDPIWDEVVRQITLVDQKDPSFIAACDVVSGHHDGTPTQRRWTKRRDGFRCRCPWCTDLSPPTDLHHTRSFASTGQTTVRNLIFVHAECHDILHHGWDIDMDEDGTAHFTDPHGQTYTTRPNGVRPTPQA